MWCKELLRWVRKLNLDVEQRSHCDVDRGKTSNHHFTVQVLRSITWNSFVQILRLQTTTHGKNSSWSRLLLPEAMHETCWHILQFWCGSYQTLNKLCHLMLQSSDLNRDWFFLQSEIDFMMPNPGVAVFPFKRLCKSLLILLTNWWFVLSHSRETWLERGIEWIHSYQFVSKLEKVYIFKCHFNN